MYAEIYQKKIRLTCREWDWCGWIGNLVRQGGVLLNSFRTGYMNLRKLLLVISHHSLPTTTLLFGYKSPLAHTVFRALLYMGFCTEPQVPC